MKKQKRGYFYSIDALIALIIIFGAIALFKPIQKENIRESTVQYDILKVSSNLKISDLQNDVRVQTIIIRDNLTNLNNSVSEQLVEFNAKQSFDSSKELFDVFLDYVYTNENPNEAGKITENVGLWVDDRIVTSKNSSAYENADIILSAREVVSGFSGENPGEFKGYSARAFLSQVSQTKYFYFGGYIGDGNISAIIEYNGTIRSADMELAINKLFEVHINGNYIGSFTGSSDSLVPKNYSLPIEYFHDGQNLIEIKNKDLFIAGGFIKIVYDATTFEFEEKKYLPGVRGIINIYDSVSIPTQLDSMEVFLHYNSPYNIFLNMGNKTVYSGNSNGNNLTLTLDNSFLSSNLDYLSLSGKTVPVRLSLKELRFTANEGNADVILITDLSRSMNNSLSNENVLGVRRGCNDNLLFDSSTARVSLAQCFDKEFIDIVTGVPGNRIALVGFFGDPSSPNKGRANRTLIFFNDTDLLKKFIEDYNGTLGYGGGGQYATYNLPVGGGCVCCALNSAYKLFEADSNKSTRKQFVVTMSDGLPIYRCRTGGSGDSAWQGTDTGWPNDEATSPISASCGTGQTTEAQQSQCTGNLDTNDCKLAILNANWSSCRLREDPAQKVNATVYSIGFGPVSQCDWANKTLNYIAECGKGKYFTSDNATLLEEFYRSIAHEIVELSYVEQIGYASGKFNQTIIYPDSYILLKYSKPIFYGLAFTRESEFINTISEGNFTVPEDSEIVEARAVSYSGAKWTDIVSIKNILDTEWKIVFNLSEYGSSYVKLGDPYTINIPISVIGKGENSVRVTTGINPQNSSGGSASNKIIYTLSKPGFAFSPILPSAVGCIWTIEFEDLTSITPRIPYNYSGEQQCSYTSSSISYKLNDAMDAAVYLLLKNLDSDLNGRVDSKFSETSMKIETEEIAEIPFVWGSEVEIRVWR